ncbi:MAG: hypothetical protein AAB974_00480 [Patescibacteria group bacterium]
MKRILIFSTLLILVAGGGLYLVVRSISPASPAVQPSISSDAESTEAFDVDVDEIATQDTLDLEATDGTNLEETSSNDTLNTEEDGFGSLDIGVNVNQ